MAGIEPGNLLARSAPAPPKTPDGLLPRDELNESNAAFLEIAPLVLCHHWEIISHQHAPRQDRCSVPLHSFSQGDEPRSSCISR